MKVFAAFALFSWALLVSAQHGQPYAGQQQRGIKALSAQEVEQYLSGAGMGYAKAAELNGYPGPMHILELSDRLHLSADQRQAVRLLMDHHKAEARAIGAKLIEAEKALDTLFQSGTAEPAVLASAVSEAARLQGSYRLAHLGTHLRAKELLSPEQIAMYVTLRGYGGEGQHKH
jgi:Spy/CpxP family protein refolding chaperone